MGLNHARDSIRSIYFKISAFIDDTSFIHSYLINSFLVCNMHLTLRDIVVNLITVSEPIVQYSLVEETVVNHVSHII